MFGDFREYAENDTSWNPALECSKFMGGSKKTDLNNIVIATWQSVIIQPKEWLEQFELVIVDEAHSAKAKSITSIMESCINAKYRFGFTGTLDGSSINKLVIEGLFGLVESIVDTRQLMDKGYLADLKIKCLLLNYGPETCRKRPKKYHDEILYLIENEKRNNFITNLECSLKGTTLILYLFVEKHGEILNDLIEKKITEQNLYYIHGGIDTNTRESYRKRIESSKEDTIIVASYGVYSQGINLTNINNIIFASPSKSRIRNLQSIGRGLRKNSEKEYCTLFDIADNLSNGGRENYSLLHFYERIKIYNEQQFEYKIHKIKMN